MAVDSSGNNGKCNFVIIVTGTNAFKKKFDNLIKSGLRMCAMDVWNVFTFHDSIRDYQLQMDEKTKQNKQTNKTKKTQTNKQTKQKQKQKLKQNQKQKTKTCHFGIISKDLIVQTV